MKVRAMMTFAGGGEQYHIGRVYELPEGKEWWLKVGLMVPTVQPEPEPEPEPKPRSRRRGKK